MDRIRIPNRAANSPIALPDIILAAPLVSRLLLGASGPGQEVLDKLGFAVHHIVERALALLSE